MDHNFLYSKNEKNIYPVWYSPTKPIENSINQNYLIIEKDIILYRAQEASPILHFKECSDTGKIGCYLSPNIEICLGIIYEKNSNLWIHKYRLEKELIVAKGKYNFRKINPDRYYDLNGNMILNVDPTPDENISHYEEIIPIVDDLNFEKFNYSEIFITKEFEKQSLKYLNSVFVKKEDSKKLLEDLIK